MLSIIPVREASHHQGLFKHAESTGDEEWKLTGIQHETLASGVAHFGCAVNGRHVCVDIVQLKHRSNMSVLYTFCSNIKAGPKKCKELVSFVALQNERLNSQIIQMPTGVSHCAVCCLAREGHR